MLEAKLPTAGPSRISASRNRSLHHRDETMNNDAARRYVDEEEDYEESDQELYEEGADEEPEYIEQDKGKGKASAAQLPRSAAREVKASKWMDLDLSMIVAFVSPIGNWLTGGDHIKNLFLIIFLIFYLHQLIEVPWRLYQSSLPRTSAHGKRRDVDDANAQVQVLARTELRKVELFYLALTVVSPFLGAAFLHHVARALGGAHALSWFSITLFVLATGVRPWSHFVARLRSRTHALHDTVHYPPEDGRSLDAEAQLEEALTRLDSAERELADLRTQVARGARLQGVCDDLSEALGALERGAQRTERRADLARSELALRVASLEAGLVQLEERRRKDAEELRAGLAGLPKEWAQAYAHARGWLRAAVMTLLAVPASLWALGAAKVDVELEKPKASPVAHANGHTPAAVYVHRDVTKRPPRLETILEAENSDASDSDGTYVSDVDRASRPSRSRSRSRSGGSAKRPAIKVFTARQPTYGEKGFDLAQRVVLWPYRASTRVLVALVPHAEKVIPAI